MLIKSYEYSGFLVEIHQHPIYNDYEFVIKTFDAKKVKGTSTIPCSSEGDAHNAAQNMIKNFK
jgi:hypothetical protein